MIFDKGSAVIIANEKDDFNVEYYRTLSVNLRDSQNHGGYVAFGEYGVQKVDLTKLSFVAETVAVEGWPAHPLDSVCYKESSAELLKLVSSISDKIRIRELTGKEKATIDSHRNDLISKLNRFDSL